MLDLLLQHWPLVLIALVLGLAARILLVREILPYQKRPSLLTDVELAFLRVLREAVGGDWVIQAMVRLADVIQVGDGAARPTSWRNRILARHVDFVLCDQETMEARLAIELDDRSHKLPHRARRDQFLGQALAAAGLPLLRVPVRKQYDRQDLRDDIDNALDK